MPISPQAPLPESLLKQEVRRARAEDVLNRPASPAATIIATTSITCGGIWLINQEMTSLPVWAGALIVAGVAGMVGNAIEMWALRRRLDAAITLLRLQQRGQDAD